MDEKSTEQRKRGVFSGREIFYFFFALFVFAVLAFSASEEWSDRREKTARKLDAKLVKAREAARCIGSFGGYVISDSQVLYYGYDTYGYYPTNHWRIYDVAKDEITDGSSLVRALEKAGPYRAALANGGVLSGWKGNLVFTPPSSTNYEPVIFQWRTNSDELHIFKWADFKGSSRRSSFPPMKAFENGWFDAVAFVDLNGIIGRIVSLGKLDVPMPWTNVVVTNLHGKGILYSSPFRQDLYVTTPCPDDSHVEIYIFSLTNLSLIFSNNAVKMPRAFDYAYATPDPSGGRVLWVLRVESKLNKKLRSVLPARFAPDPALPTWYLYSSDLHATKFKYVCAVKTDQGGPNFLWGSNADSIWLLDGDEGIKRVELK